MPLTLEQVAWNRGIPNYIRKEVPTMETLNRFALDYRWTQMLDEAGSRAFGLRWGRAEELVEAEAVHQAGAGIYQVTSQTDQAIRYWVSIGEGCQCPDAEGSRAPWGWCKHRLAAWMYREEELKERDTTYKFHSWNPDVEARYYPTQKEERAQS